VSRAARTLAVAASALLGIVGGVVSGVLIGEGHGVDPLRLGVTMVNQPCSDDTLLVVARGDTARALGSRIASESNVHYLDTRKSCDAAWSDPDKPPPRYIAYLGPYHGPNQACPERISRRGGLVTTLTASETDPVQCLCYLSFASRPTLRTGMDVTPETSVYIRMLQRMLTDLHRNPQDHSTGTYDQLTEQEIRKFQQDHGISANGVVEQPTWEALSNDGCSS
jgi:Putative peptidoglycan binding domain